ncbi:MAG: nidogen-like domain-containing protein, partial [Dehalococcoidia bacterium]
MARRIWLLIVVLAFAAVSGTATSIAGPAPTPTPTPAPGSRPAGPTRQPSPAAPSGPATPVPSAAAHAPAGGVPLPADPSKPEPRVDGKAKAGAAAAPVATTAKPAASPQFNKPAAAPASGSTARASTSAPTLGNGAVWPGFDSTVTPPNDDDSFGRVNLGFSVDYYGTVFNQVYVNNNGNLTFGNPLQTYTPFDLTGATGIPILAPFFADVQTNTPNSAVLKYGTQTMNLGGGNIRNAFGATWYGVGYYGDPGDKLNYFQVVLIDRSDIAPNNWDLYFNYDGIQWETGDLSGGSGGLGGQSAHAGFSNGSGQNGTNFEFIGSGVPGSFLDGNPNTALATHAVGSNVAGRYAYIVRTGDSGTRTPAAITFWPPSPNASGNDLYLETGHSGFIGGWVVDGQNGAVPNWQVDLTTTAGSLPQTETTDASGWFSAQLTAPVSTGTATVNASAHGTAAHGTTTINILSSATFGVSFIDPANVTDAYQGQTLTIDGTGFDPNATTLVALSNQQGNTLAKDHPSNLPATVSGSQLTVLIPDGMDGGLYDVTVSDSDGHHFTHPGGFEIRAQTGPGDVFLPGLPPIHYNDHHSDGNGGTIYSDITMSFIEYTGTVDYQTDGSLHATGGGLVAHTSNQFVPDIPLYSGDFTFPANQPLAFAAGTPINFAGFGLQLTSLTYHPGSDPNNPCAGGSWTVSGQLQIPGGSSVSVNNLNLQSNGITGQVSIDNLDIFGFQIQHAQLSFDTINGNYDGAASLQIPWVGGVSGTITYRNGGLDDVSLTVDPLTGIPLGPTGVEISSITGGAHGLQSGSKEFDLGVNLNWPNFDLPGVDWGPIHINPPCHRLLGATNIMISLTLGGDNTPRVSIGAGVSVCDGQYQLANVDATFSPDGAEVKGNVTLGSFSGSLDVTIGYSPFSFDGSIQGSYSGTCGFWLWAHPCSISGGFGISNTRGLYWTGGGGRAGLSGAAHLTRAQLRATSTVTSSFGSLPVTDGTGVPQRMLIDAHGVGTVVPAWQFPTGATVWTPTTETSGGSPTLTATVPAGLTGGSLGAKWATGSTDLNLKEPSGTVITPTSLPAGVLYYHPAGATAALYTFPTGMAAGTWTVQFPVGFDPSTLGVVTPVLLAPVSGPAISLSAVTANTNGTFTIPYTASADSNVGGVGLFYNAANSTTSGTSIANGLALGSGSYIWTPPTNLPSGTFYIYGVVNDGATDPLSALAPQPIHWTNTLTPPAPTGLASTAQNGILHATWTAVSGATINSYSLTVLNGAGTLVKAVPVGAATHYDVTGLTPGSYQLEVSAALATGLSSPNSALVPAPLPAPSYPVLTNLQWSSSGSTPQSTVIVSAGDSNTTSIAIVDNGKTVYGPVAPGSSFSVAAPLTPGSNQIVLTATSSTGDTVTVSKTLSYVFATPTLALANFSWNGTTTHTGTLALSGNTDIGNTLRVNGSLVTVSGAGAFSSTLTLNQGSNTVTLRALNGQGQSAVAQGTITFRPLKPVVSGLSVREGPLAGSTDVTVTGSNFCPGGALVTSVNFGPNPGTNVRCTSSTQLTVTSPAGTGTVDVQVTVGGQQSDPVTADQFVYTTSSGTLTFTTQPGKGNFGKPLPVQPVVTLEDANSQPVTSFNGVVTLSIKANTGASGATLTNATATAS